MPRPLILATVASLAALVILPATARAGCTVSADPVAFGTIDPTRLNQSTGKVRVNCDAATSYQVGLTGVNHGGQRVMTRPEGERMIYQLFTEPSLSVPWGDNATIGPTVSGNADGTTFVDHTIYGAIPPQIGIFPGNYSDQLSVTLSF